MVLVHKRLEGGKFVWPQVQDGLRLMSPAQLAALLEDLDWRPVRPKRAASAGGGVIAGKRPIILFWLARTGGA